MTVSEKSIGGYGLLNENWLFGITNTESKKHRADCFREIGERTFSFFLDTAVEQGFEDREGQWTMSCEIVDAMQKKKHIAIEAGVGIGKSFAYIVPLLFYHQKYHCPILIATSTIALQDQLASDIKIIEDMIDYHPTVTIAKGQTHFLCKKRFDEFFLDKKTRQKYSEIYEDVERDGHERSDWNADISDFLWNQMNVKEYNPMYCRQRCSYRGQCYYHNLRQRLPIEYGIILCNQDLLAVNMRKRLTDSKELFPHQFEFVVIDEAHNLVERGRQMYSASICKEDFLGIKKKVRYEDEKLTERLEDCNRGLLAMKRECEEYKVLNSVSHIYLKLLNLMTELERFLEECEKEDIREEVLEFYFHIRSFMDIHERLDENYVIYSELDGEGKFRVHLFCVNPAGNLGEFLQKGNSTIFFSATLLPITYYKKLLSTGKEDYAIYAESPFDVEHRLLMVGGDVSTKYTRRNEEMYQRYARYLWKLANGKKGNYLVFFPSYRFLEDVYEAFEKIQEKEELEAFPALDHQITCVTQSQSMSEKGREEFLNTFEEERKESLIGFCVMGGIFSEGIDLTEDKLIGAVIVGTGLPQVCREREILKDYFNQHGQRGFDYAYLYPGMNKVLQAAGRVIRTDEDRGVILLLDDRFFDRRYQETFPREWENQRSCSLGNMAEQIEEFWKKEKEEAQTVRKKE